MVVESHGRSFNPREDCPDSRALLLLYRDLSGWLEYVENTVPRMEDVSQKICLTVLEEDLRALIEECEEHLIGDVAVEETSVDSLESRGLTVLEELESLSGH